MKNTFYFILKALFVLKIFIFLFWLFDHVGKQLDEEANINFKNIQKSCNEEEWGGETSYRTLFVFFKMLYTRLRQVISTLVCIYFGGTWLGHKIKTNLYQFRLSIQRYAQVRFFIKGCDTNFSRRFCVWSLEKNIPLTFSGGIEMWHWTKMG